MYVYLPLLQNKLISVRTRIHLKLDDSLPPWPLNISITDALINPRINTLTPTNPELGYVITKADINWVSRAQKLDRLWEEYGYKPRDQKIYWTREQLVDRTKVPFWFQVNEGDIGAEEVEWLYRGGLRNQRFNSNILPLIERLHLQMYFSKMDCEAKCPDKPHPMGIYFQNFYPLDLGPLPFNPDSDYCKKHPFISSGLKIHLPPDFEELTRIDAKFILQG